MWHVAAAYGENGVNISIKHVAAKNISALAASWHGGRNGGGGGIKAKWRHRSSNSNVMAAAWQHEKA